MDMQSFVGSKYLGAADYPRPAIVTIEQINEELIGEEKKRKSLIFFARVEKALVLNKINISNLIEIMGTSESDEWIGRQVEIYTDPNVMYAGKRTPALRLRAPSRQAPPVQAKSNRNPTDLVTDDTEIPDPGMPMRSAKQRTF